jgi:hypothetical protein
VINPNGCSVLDVYPFAEVCDNGVVTELVAGDTFTCSVTNFDRRHKWLSPYSYNGKAVAGSSESDAVWKIVRIEVAGDGSVVEIKTLNNVKWSEILTLIF